MTDDHIRTLLREMRDEPAPPESVARVDIGASRRIRRRRTVWLFSGAFAAAACFALAIFSLRSPQPGTPDSVVRFQPAEPTPAPPISLSPERKPPGTATPARRPRIGPIPAKREDVVIRIETPDPDVVILLIGGE
jgi:hypothetical protein